MIRFRIIPLLLVACWSFLAIKVGDILEGSKIFSNNLLIADIHAKQAEEEGGHGGGGEGGGHGEGGKKPAKKEKEKKKPKEKKEKESKGDSSKISTEKPAESPLVKKDFSTVEIDLLQNLSKRREELDQQARELATKENTLRATEAIINKKMADMKKLESDIKALLDQYDQKEDVKISSLVKIYENMKPKEAARIFEEVDMPILLQVVDKMKENKVAPILAQMSPTRAKEITIQLAEQRKLPATANADANNSPAAITLPEGQAPQGQAAPQQQGQ